MSDAARLCQVTLDAPLAVVRMNRPEKYNALNLDMIDELLAAVERVEREPDARVAIITGSGKAFMSGADIAGYGAGDLAAFMDFQTRAKRLYLAIERSTKPWVAAVNGYALGGGFELALVCDVIVAAEEARFGLPEVRLGLVPGGGGTQRLTDAVGVYRARQLLLTGQAVPAAQMSDWGVVAEVVPGDALLAAAGAWARRIAENGPRAVRHARALATRPGATRREAYLELEHAALMDLFACGEGQEGILAFLEKRPPRFDQTP